MDGTLPIPIIPLMPKADLIHTADQPFCSDPDCPCHEDPEAVAMVQQWYMDGLVTAEDATAIVTGRRLLW